MDDNLFEKMLVELENQLSELYKKMDLCDLAHEICNSDDKILAFLDLDNITKNSIYSALNLTDAEIDIVEKDCAVMGMKKPLGDIAKKIKETAKARLEVFINKINSLDKSLSSDIIEKKQLIDQLEKFQKDLLNKNFTNISTLSTYHDILNLILSDEEEKKKVMLEIVKDRARALKELKKQTKEEKSIEIFEKVKEGNAIVEEFSKLQDEINDRFDEVELYEEKSEIDDEEKLPEIFEEDKFENTEIAEFFDLQEEKDEEFDVEVIESNKEKSNIDKIREINLYATDLDNIDENTKLELKGLIEKIATKENESILENNNFSSYIELCRSESDSLEDLKAIIDELYENNKQGVFREQKNFVEFINLLILKLLEDLYSVLEFEVSDEEINDKNNMIDQIIKKIIILKNNYLNSKDISIDGSDIQGLSFADIDKKSNLLFEVEEDGTISLEKKINNLESNLLDDMNAALKRLANGNYGPTGQYRIDSNLFSVRCSDVYIWFSKVKDDYLVVDVIPKNRKEETIAKEKLQCIHNYVDKLLKDKEFYDEVSKVSNDFTKKILGEESLGGIHV